ncbi:hypothetical protein SAMN05880582_10342 [Rhizobium sp. RU20A]|uniref:hypothetical protein n=1 Tax=Rhizobium sp. RU20A TaxID=1907412 RepID=UPI0009548671|nr:hypothetical protein [Rhizobium sp. RU20A]SIQ69245.1 hypothetical protein SAMN05880582_10342 [Rhizobium sp. RU20A]
MPGFEEVSVYLRGIHALVMGRRDGLAWLDISAAGVWRSFSAIVWSLPALAIGWASFRLSYLSGFPAGTSVGASFFVKLLIVDILSWIGPLVIIAILSRPLGFSDMIAPLIVASNWFSLPALYLGAVPIALNLIAPQMAGFASFLMLVVLFGSIFALFRIVRSICGEQTLLAVALTTLFILPAVIIAQFLQHAFGLG